MKRFGLSLLKRATRSRANASWPVGEFPTVGAAQAYYHNPAYQDAVQHRFLRAGYRVFIVKGL
jgi:uncharacterized protein (DUF1330 family)